jgi:diaminohydroxyphosphoribosylaminopyrimidine deaminase/5-amino-6-(5-phosphoribosylamino)uracil reductase
MAAAVRLSRRGLGRTAPNPSVGALVVVDGRIVGRGVTAIGGRPHAEPQALAEAGEAARGATLYVTLEPCSHHGRTPPCVDAIIAAGVARVVAAVEDPDPRVAGRGFARLGEAGIAVTVGVGAADAEAALAGYLCRVRLGRPQVTLKLAVSADRRIGRRDTPNLKVTGAAAHDRVHLMRAEADAVAVGIGTAAVDDPALTVRLAGMAETSPVRVVFDSRLRLSVDSRLVRSARDLPVVVIAAASADPERRRMLAGHGVEVVGVASGPDGRVAPAAALAALAELGFGSLLVEGGAELAETLLAADLVDRIALFESDLRLGDDALAAPAALGAALGTEAPRFRVEAHERPGADRLTLWTRIAPPVPLAPRI